MIFCESSTVVNHKSNNNRCEETIFYFVPIGILDSNGCSLDNCQANNNFVNELESESGLESLVIVFYISDYFGGSRSNNLNMCEASENILHSAVARSSWEQGVFMDIIAVSDAIVTNCKAINNVIEQPDAFTGVIGILNVYDSTFINCVANGNRGGSTKCWI